VDELTGLLLAAAGGDRMALASFVRRTQADVWRFMAHLVDPASADDLTQELYVRALGSVPGFRGDSSARTWLLSVARRVAADEIRRRQRRRRRLADSHPYAEAQVETEPDATVDVELRELVAGLDEDRRAAFVLTQLLGLSYAEAAVACGVAVGTIRSRVSRAREDLVAMLADQDPDEIGLTGSA